MKKSYHLFLFAFLFLVLIFVYLEMYLLLKDVPLSAYNEYVAMKFKYNCGSFECFSRLNRCSLLNTSSSYIFIIDAGYRGSAGPVSYFNENGERLCDVYIAVEDCRTGCPEKFVTCPDVSNCSIIAGN